MRHASRFVPLACSAAAAAVLAGCTFNRSVSLDVPTVPAPSAVVTVPAAPAVVTVPSAPAVVTTAAVEFGRVKAIEYFPGGTAVTRISAPVAVVGGAVISREVGRASARDAATVLGGSAGTTTTVTSPSYRVTIQTDAGTLRTYDVPATGDLRVGDRVRVDNGVIYRS
jgi:hypothetical protein